MIRWTLTIAVSAVCCSTVSAAGIEPLFEPQLIDGQVQIGYGLAWGRVDEDQHPDILLADKSEIVWYANPGVPDQPWAKHVIARNLTARDNVCLAARDLDGDGLVEIAVGANWNPGETSDTSASGALFYLRRPADPRGPWSSIPLTPHDPTTHRMHWVKTRAGMRLAVLPLHGVGNQRSSGETVLLGLYDVTAGSSPSLVGRLNTEMHATHNFELLADDAGGEEVMFVAGQEGFVELRDDGSHVAVVGSPPSRGAGEVRHYPAAAGRAFVAIEPMHGNEVVLYEEVARSEWRRTVLDANLSQGHALAAGDLLGTGRAQVVAGWREKDDQGKVGVRMYIPQESGWRMHTVDDNQMACEDLKLVDLDADGKLDIVAAGRATGNLVVYWNRSR